MTWTDRCLEALVTTWLKRPEKFSEEYAEKLVRIGYWLVARSRRRGL